MPTDLLRSQSNERVDLSDFQFATDAAIQANLRQLHEGFHMDPAKSTGFIIDGFEITNPAGNEVQVALGRALLAHREGGQVFNGYLATIGDVTKTVDVSGLADLTYGVFVRFEFVDAATASRVFWNPAGSGSEFAQTIATRRKANWSMRIEFGSPGAEWLKIGEAVVVAGNLNSFAQQQPFYFEGVRSDTYESGWSTDGGGVALDRDSDRAANGVKDLQTFSGSMRQCLEDIKGRGLRRWWDRDIGGMNVGFDADPVEDRIGIGDAFFNLDFSTVTPVFNVDDEDSFDFNRGLNRYSWVIANLTKAAIDSSGMSLSDGLYVGSAAGVPTNDDIYADGGINCGGAVNPLPGDGIFINGLYVGADGVPVADRVTIGDDFLYMELNVDSFLNFDSTDFIQYDRSEDHYLFKIGGVTQFEAHTNGIRIVPSAAPGVPVSGDFYLDTASGLPSVRRPSSEWSRLIGKVYALTVDQPRTTSGDFGGAYTIPANTLNIASAVTVTASGVVTGDGGGGNASLDFEINGGTQFGTTIRPIVTGETFYFSAKGIPRIIGAGGSWIWSGIAVFGAVGATEVVCSSAVDVAPTDSGIVLAIELTLSIGGGGNEVTLQNLLVEISD